MSNGLIIPGAQRQSQPDVDMSEVRRVQETLRLNHREHKRAMVLSLDSLLGQLSAANVLADQPATRTIIRSHIGDLQLPETKLDVNVAVISEKMRLPSRELVDLVLYRTIDRSLAFGYWNGRYIPNGTPAVCITMRSLRFVEEMLPDELYDSPELQLRYEGFSQMLGALAGLLESDAPNDAPGES